MPGEVIPKNAHSSRTETGGKANNNKKELNVEALSGQICYFSLTGNLALQAFDEIHYSTFAGKNRLYKLKQALLDRLHFAVLMFDRVVIHCSDPLRSELVLSVLEDNQEWIQKGKIVFVASNHIHDFHADYKAYIDRKIQEYTGGFHSVTEADSLRQDFMTSDYYERVIRILDQSPYLIRKSTDESYSFPKLILNDLSSHFQNEQVIIDVSSELPQVLSLSLTLYQLLHARGFSSRSDTGAVEYIFPTEVVDNVIKGIKKHLNQDNTIARTAIVDSLKETLKESKITEIQERLFDAISLRMDVLYCTMNSGKQMILEFHPSYEQRSIYQVNCFFKYLQLISQTTKKVKLNKSKIDRILNEPVLPAFRISFLASMADVKEQMNLAQVEYRQYKENAQKKFEQVVQNYIDIEGSAPFNSIGRIINGEEQ